MVRETRTCIYEWCDNEGLKKDYSIPDLNFVNRDIMDSINESVVPSINQSKPFIAKF